AIFANGVGASGLTSIFVPPRLSKWYSDSAPIAVSRGGAVNPIVASRGRSLLDSRARPHVQWV
ncbi:Uncharacterized protein APZ42_003593, partial [Daphnia magna]